MTISSNTASASYTGNGVTAIFPVPFYFLTDTDLKVSRRTAAGVVSVLVLNSDYTVSDAGNQAGGSVTTIPALPAGDQLFIERNVAAVQETAYPDNGYFPASSHEKALDRLTMLAQQVLTALGFKLGRGPLDTSYDVGGNRLANIGDAIDGKDAPSLTQVQGLIVAGAAPALAGENGSALVGFKSAGPGSVTRTVQDKLRDVVNVSDFGAVGDGSTDDYAAITAGISYLASIGGGSLVFQAKPYAIGQAIVIADSNITLQGQGGNIPHDGGSGSPAGTSLVWKGATGATMLTFQTPSSTSNSKRQGGGVRDMVLDCQATASTGLYVHTWNNGRFEGLHVSNPTTVAILTSCYPAGAVADSSDTQHNTFTRCTWRAIDSAAVQSAHGVILTSDAPFTNGSNTSFNTFIECYGQTYNGDCWRLIDCDNNALDGCSGFALGTGKVLRMQGAYGNTFKRWSGSVKIEGVASGAGQNSTANVFLAVDESNGTAYPTLDAGCSVQWHGHKYGWVYMTSQKAVLADSQSAALSELANIGNDTLRVFNAAQSGIALTDGTATYSLSQDGSHNLRLIRSGAAGTLDLTQGSGVSLKALKVGFNGSSPLAKPTVTGSKGSNAALASLLSALSGYGLVTDSTT